MVSIIVPCFNYGHFITEALKSIAGQTYADWECVIVNDGSTDDSRSVIETFIRDDPRFRLVNIQNSGVSVARNTAVAHSRGTWLFPLDADNRMLPDCLAKCMAQVQRDPGLRLVYTEAELFGAETGLWRLPPFDYKTMLKYNMIDNSCLFRREDFDRVGGYRTNMVYGLEDWDFNIALLHGVAKDRVFKIDEPMYQYRVNEAGRRLTVAASGRQKTMLDLIVYNNFAIYQEYFPGIFDRIHAYDFDRTMLKKKPVKWLVKTLVGLSSLKGRRGGGGVPPAGAKVDGSDGSEVRPS
jgi:glycosyltransferase involved in cell wall biosynthesis